MLGERCAHARERRLIRLTLAVMAMLAASAAIAPVAGARMHRPRAARLTRTLLAAPVAPGTPTTIALPQLGRHVELNRVGILKIAPKGESAPNVLVLEPGTSAAAAYFVPFAKSLVQAVPGWQVWAVERRENFLENQKELDKYKAGKVSSEEFFDFYLGYLANSSITKHYEPVPESTVEFAKSWGMNVAVEDLKVVIEEAKKLGGKVVLGGHSLGGSVVTAYAT
ncbi:MAG TPA: hypothetical protein VED41_14095, partial [Solirubrobacteraceae bacterium]|nr:hypothetical protein [Solirubrobacteraceae bacterium]